MHISAYYSFCPGMCTANPLVCGLPRLRRDARTAARDVRAESVRERGAIAVRGKKVTSSNPCE